MLIDTHTHLDSPKFDNDREAVIARAVEAGVGNMINIGFDRETIPTTMALAERYDFIYAAVGWHPVDSIEMREDDLAWIEELCKHDKVVAIGEIGLDYHWDTSPKEVQQRVFREQIRLARRIGKPIVIHNRDAHDDVVRILREERASEVGGVMHCFSGSWETAKQCLDMNFYISFGGPITFKNARVPKEVLAKVPLDRILVETDAPYLSPDPYRGKRNESGYVVHVAEAASQILGINRTEFEAITTENAKNCFGLRQFNV
ncbi:hydrolase TatD [Paenibacillus darwinianus]|uniref:Hydrolase TatD n=1 Tax=Paenibacillus darwinianus TaxID=1380763 RepID=A0A9W5RZK5_9BACL|nr:TatD family hydrolase [Paenibacillus darwinianus]EXX86129.1 hydrolase TatD [Paenibacillus darwinianus]EXX86343.1 hydrolase TatD [Paenibacillus darwinianus]EXX88521.1 hydrolase TatD [Paenibacillus darwinianus]